MNFNEQKTDALEPHARQPTAHSQAAASPWRDPLPLVPGLALSAAIAAAALGLRIIPGTTAFSPMVVAFVIGIVAAALFGSPRTTAAGVRFTAKNLLRFGVALLGLQLTIYQLADLGGRMLMVVVAILIATFLFTKWLGIALGVERALAELLAAGTSVCGASAIIATNAVTGAQDQDVGYAVACVSLFGTLSMIVYPLLFGVLHLDVRTYGLWAGSSIHEVAQVVAAAFQIDSLSGQIAVPVKLARVALLAPLVLTLGALRFRRGGASGAPQVRLQQIFPFFMAAFVLLVALNSAIAIPASWHGWIAQITTFLLTMSLAAIGLETSLRELRHKGVRPILLTGLATLFIAAVSLIAVEVFA
jgi:uncharacterized integral membrane protein (TIGR00698 family)